MRFYEQVEIDKRNPLWNKNRAFGYEKIAYKIEKIKNEVKNINDRLLVLHKSETIILKLRLLQLKDEKELLESKIIPID